jgi:hypothetical protein
MPPSLRAFLSGFARGHGEANRRMSELGHELPRRFVAVAPQHSTKLCQPAVAVFSVTEVSDDLMEI